MAEYIDISTSVVEEASIGGTQELKEFSEQTLGQYITRFQLHTQNLQLCKTYFGSAASQVSFDNESTSIMSQMKKVHSQMNNLKTYPSSKGGDDIFPTDQLENTVDDIAAQTEINSQTNLQAVQNNIEYNKAINSFQRVVLEISRDVYKLRQEVTGITEHFAFTYSGGRNKMVATTVPVDQFFNELLNNPSFSEVLKLEQRGTGIKDWSLRFNNRATKSVLAQLVENGKGINYVIDEILNENGKSVNAKNLYNTAKKVTYNKFVSYKELNKKERAKVDSSFGNDVDRVSYKYLVVRKSFQTGFIAQSIFNAFMNQTNYKYETDRIAWYKGVDVIKNGTNIGYSVKNLLDQAPTLFALNSVERALHEINVTLTRVKNLGFDKIKSVLKQAVFSPAKELNAPVNAEIEDLLNILGV